VCARNNRPSGFTLIELLVVIAIIATLIAILLPSLKGAREAGRMAVCLSNQKQIAGALANYGLASKDVVPREGSYVFEATDAVQRRFRLPWPVALRPLLDDRVSPNEDPNDLFVNAPYYSDPARPRDGHRIHYVVNAMPMIERGVVDSAGARATYWRRRGPQVFTRMPFASSTLYMTEFSDDENLTMWNAMQTQPQEDLYISQLYDIWDILHITPQSSQYRIGASRHMGSGNVMYLDGHAATVKKAVLENVDTWDDHDYGVRSEAPSWAQ
jgi:prepilin-type N-terminal cleavage/methylation domain-containing protein/prepilin-type processing-associated H-X9-DG protein